MEGWATEELRSAQLGDSRLRGRLVKLVEDLATQPGVSVAKACGNWAATKGAYRFWSSEQVEASAIRQAHVDGTVRRIEASGEDTILVVQDTTELDYTAHQRTKGLGFLDCPTRQGLKVHSALAVSAQGVPLGLIHQKVWVRDVATKGKSAQRQQRKTVDKESQRWLTAQEATLASLPAGPAVVTIADQEADIYDLFRAPRRAGGELLIRVSHDRRVEHEEQYLWAAIERAPVAGTLEVALGRAGDRQPRQLVLTVRFATLSILPPRHYPQRALLPPVMVQLVLAQEENPPAGVEGVCWLLLTTLPVSSLAEAVRMVHWYCFRWLVERYHFVLKSGCGLEELQLETAARIERALATYCIVAWRLLWLTYAARRHPQLSCAGALELTEWQALYCFTRKTKLPPDHPPTMQEAVLWIAKLGGFLARRHDGEPGVKVIWRGLQRLNDIAATWRLLRSSPMEAT